MRRRSTPGCGRSWSTSSGRCQQQLALLKDAESQFKASFESLAGAALRTSTEEFLRLADQKLGNIQKDAIGEIDRRQQALDELIKPIRDALTKVDRRLTESEMARVETSATLATLIRQLAQGQDQLRDETQNLVRALRTPSVRGRWGEMQLRRVVELAGMLPYCDFDEQPTLIAEFGRQRPDLIVRLPGGKTIVVDAKVPLEAYLDASDTQDDAVRERRDDRPRAPGARPHEQAGREELLGTGAALARVRRDVSPRRGVFSIRAAARSRADRLRRALPGLSGEPDHADRAAAGRRAGLAARAAGAERRGDPGARARNCMRACRKMTEYLDTLRTRLDSTVKAFNEAVGFVRDAGARDGAAIQGARRDVRRRDRTAADRRYRAAHPA